MQTPFTLNASLYEGWFCNNIIEYLLLGKDFLWSKAINLLNMSLKDSPGTCTVNVIGFVICLNTHKHYYVYMYLSMHIYNVLYEI